MEGLAIVVTAILLYTLIALVAMIFTLRTPPQSSLIRAILVVLYLPAIYIAARLAYQNTPLLIRALAIATVVLGVLNLIKLIRGASTTAPRIRR